MDATGGAVDALGEPDVILALGAHLQQGAAQDGNVRQGIGGQGAQVEPEVEVDDAVAGQRVIKHLRAGDLRFLQRYGLARPFQVRAPEQRQGGQRLGAVGLLLQRGQCLRVLHDGLRLGVAHRRALPVEPLPFLGVPALAQAGVRRHHQGEAVRVVQQVLPDHLLEASRV